MLIIIKIYILLNVKTEIDNLYLCGASTFSHRFAGVTVTVLQAAAKILNCKVKDLLKEDGPDLKISYSDKRAV